MTLEVIWTRENGGDWKFSYLDKEFSGPDRWLTSLCVYPSILDRYPQPNRKYYCYKCEQTKQHNDTWREPPAVEFIIRIRITAKTPK